MGAAAGFSDHGCDQEIVFGEIRRLKPISTLMVA
jgi:hypothetical protein